MLAPVVETLHKKLYAARSRQYERGVSCDCRLHLSEGSLPSDRGHCQAVVGA